MEFVKSADVVVIGGGIVGTAVLRELSKYDLKCVLLEKEPDIAIGTTKANSAILHAGFDAPTGSLKAITNVRGNALYHELQNELDLDIKWTGSLVAATTDEEMQTLQELLQRGKKNGVEGLQILSKEEVLEQEPNLTTVKGALWAPSAAYVGRSVLLLLLLNALYKTVQKLSATARYWASLRKTAKLLV